MPYDTNMIHYSYIIMSAMASEITGLTIVYSIVYLGADQRKHQSSASLTFVWGIHWSPVNSPHKRPVTRKNVSIWWRHHDKKSPKKWQMNAQAVSVVRFTNGPYAHGDKVIQTNKLWSISINVVHVALISLHLRHNERHGVSNHQPHDCLLNRLL